MFDVSNSQLSGHEILTIEAPFVSGQLLDIPIQIHHLEDL
jgi:hypothetical protein